MYAGWVNMTDPHEVMAFDRCQWDEKHDGMETQHDYTPDKRDTQMRPFTLHVACSNRIQSRWGNTEMHTRIHVY